MIRILILCTALFCLASSILPAQNPTLQKFIETHIKEEDSFSIKVPAWMVSIGSEVTHQSSEDASEKAAAALLGTLGTVRLLSFQTSEKTRGEINNLLSRLESKHDYERWATIRSKNSGKLHLSVQMQGDEIHEIVAVLSETEDNKTILVHAFAEMTADDLAALLDSALDDN